MATCCRERAVVVAVYVERPRRRLKSNTCHHHQQHFRQANRKAELLEYARDLRTSARSGASSPVHSSSHIIKPRTVQVTPAQREPRKTIIPTCLGNWKLLLPSFVTAITVQKTSKINKNKKKNRGSTITKIATLMKSLQMQKKKSYFSNLFATLRDRR